MDRGYNVQICRYKVSLRKKLSEKFYRPVNLIVQGFINGMHAVEISNAWCVSEILVIKSSRVSPTRRASTRSSKYHRFPHEHFIPSRPLSLSQRSWWLNCHESPLHGDPQLGVANIIDLLMDFVTPIYVWSFVKHMDLMSPEEVSKQRWGAFYGVDLCEKSNRTGRSAGNLVEVWTLSRQVGSPWRHVLT